MNFTTCVISYFCIPRAGSFETLAEIEWVLYKHPEDLLIRLVCFLLSIPCFIQETIVVYQLQELDTLFCISFRGRGVSKSSPLRCVESEGFPIRKGDRTCCGISSGPSLALLSISSSLQREPGVLAQWTQGGRHLHGKRGLYRQFGVKYHSRF